MNNITMKKLTFTKVEIYQVHAFPKAPGCITLKIYNIASGHL